MASDNLIYATNSMRTSVTALKKKLSNLKIQIEVFDSEIEKIEDKFDKVLQQAEIYKSKLERELGREVRRLERELTLSRKGDPIVEKPVASEKELSVARTVGILDSILRLMSEGAADFKLMSEAILFPAVIERVMAGDEEAYFVDEVPHSAEIIIARGREYVAWIRSEYETHLTDPETWEKAIDVVTTWWKNDALPLFYGCRDDQWDIDVPLTLQEMLIWQEEPGERPISFPAIFDAYEIYNKNKDVIYEDTGLRQFELKHFSY